MSQLSFTQITRQVAGRQHYIVPSCWMWDVIFSIQAEKVREEWWLNAGSHWEFDLIPQTGRIQNGNSCYHPFCGRVKWSLGWKDLSPPLLPFPFHFFLSSLLPFPIQDVKKLKFCFKILFYLIKLIFFFSLLPFYYPLSTFSLPSLFLSITLIFLMWFLVLS